MIIEFTHDWGCPLAHEDDEVRQNDWVYTGERLEGCDCQRAALQAYWEAHQAAYAAGEEG